MLICLSSIPIKSGLGKMAEVKNPKKGTSAKDKKREKDEADNVRQPS